MNKRMRELLAEMQEKQAELKGCLEGETKDLEKSAAILDEIDEMKKEYDLLERSMGFEKDSIDVDEIEEKKAQVKEVDSIKAFAQAARNGFKAMNEGTPADGGYTVPEDISTQIQELRTAKASLLDFVTVEHVTTNRGARTFKKRSQQTGFTKVGEGAAIGAKATPQFARYSYEIEKYAGYFPVTNELLEDSDANVASTLMRWIADESRVTANKLILAELQAGTAVEISGLDDIKRVLNVKLGQAFKGSSVIVTNDDGLQWLDTLKDNDEDYLLKTNPQDPMRLQLSAGATVVPVHVIPNEDMASEAVYALSTDTTVKAGKTYYTLTSDVYTAVAAPTGNPSTSNYYEQSGEKIPFFIGDFKEAIVYFDRKQMSIAVSNIAAIGELNAFEEDLTIYRAIEREDVVTRDAEAFYACELDTSATPAG